MTPLDLGRFCYWGQGFASKICHILAQNVTPSPFLRNMVHEKWTQKCAKKCIYGVLKSLSPTKMAKGVVCHIEQPKK